MATIDQGVFKAMEWRCIGPHRGGRTVAAVGDPDDPMTFYFGACNGGVWKTDDGGAYWENISDGSSRPPPWGLSPSPTRTPTSSTPEWARPASGTMSPRRRRVQVHGQGQDLAARGPVRQQAHLASPHPSQQPGPRVRGRAGPRLGAQRRAGLVPLQRRGRQLGQGPLRERQGGRHRPCRWTRPTPASCTPPSGRCSATPGRFRAAAPIAGCTSPRTEATPGRRSRTTPAFPRA